MTLQTTSLLGGHTAPQSLRAPESPVTVARKRVVAERKTLDGWRTKLAAVTSELEVTLANVGEAVLDAPDVARDLSSSIATLRTRIEVTEKAVLAQGSRVALAERAYLIAEAAELVPLLEAAREQLAQHQAKTDRLLALLEDHECKFVEEQKWANTFSMADRLAGMGEAPRQWTIPKSSALHARVELHERQVQIMDALIAGDDPMALVHMWGVDSSVFPACVYGPDALVPAPAYVTTVNRARARLAELEQLAREIPSDLQRMEQRDEVDGRLISNAGVIEHRQAVADHLPEALAAARGLLAELVGSTS